MYYRSTHPQDRWVKAAHYRLKQVLRRLDLLGRLGPDNYRYKSTPAQRQRLAQLLTAEYERTLRRLLGTSQVLEGEKLPRRRGAPRDRVRDKRLRE